MKSIKIYDDMVLKKADNKLDGIIKYWYDERENRGPFISIKGTIISISGEFRNGIELSKFILPAFTEDSHSFIIDFSNYKYTGGDRFFDWYYFLKDIYSDISLLESENGFPTELSSMFPKNNILIVYSNFCKDAILSLIEDERLTELDNKCFISIDDAIDFILIESKK